jgi:hypothetical protein
MTKARPVKEKKITGSFRNSCHIFMIISSLFADVFSVEASVEAKPDIDQS